MRWMIGWGVVMAAAVPLAAAEVPPPDYNRQVAPLLRKYCAGCHNPTDRDGKFSVDSYADLQQGSEHGPVILPGDSASSRMIRVLTGAVEPKMPPEGEPAPTAEEIALLAAWIDAGAQGPDGAEPDRLTLHVPEIATRTDLRPIAAVALSPDGRTLAVGRYQSVTLQPLPLDPSSQASPRTIGSYPGKVTAVHFDAVGERLLTASGVAGLGGVAALWRLSDGELIREFRGHRDLMYDAELSPDGRVLATCSYDRQILLWDVETGAPLRTLSGHNGAVYDVAFSPDGRFLVSASADDTCKVWRVADGERMDTLGQPLKEQYSVTFSPDGRFIVAGGADNRIRVWRFVSRDKPRINPLVLSRFAHEGAVVQLAFSADGRRLVSAAEDRTVKVWETQRYTELYLRHAEGVVSAAAVAGGAEDGLFVLGALDGTLTSVQLADLPRPSPAPRASAAPVKTFAAGEDEPMTAFEEQEPNNDPLHANRVDPPVRINGRISGRVGEVADFDLYRFAARAGEEWVLEVNAARSKSPLDSFLEVLDADGRPMERLLLQAVRDSYFTFRGKNADEVGDFRLFNWEEMELNEYLYANGEVVKLWMYPRGPDSGFNVYPGRGSRWGYFDTTPLAHALGEPCYIVQPHLPGTRLIPNGLPVFPLYYENDDESRRTLGADSKLFFTAPADGEYLVRIRDVRGFEGEDYTYRLLIRPPQPDFRISIHDVNPQLPPGGIKEFRVSAERRDNFDGPITVELTGLPPGFTASTPIVIEAGQIDAYGVIRCAPDAPEPTPQNQAISIATGTAEIQGELVSHPGNGLGKINLEGEPALSATILPAPGGARPVASPPGGPLEFEIHPGETIMLKVAVERLKHQGEIEFGKEDSGRNLPHGVYVDNIGLNGLMLLEGQTEREFVLTCAPWVPEQSRLFHLRTAAGGGVATPPVLLHVRAAERRPVSAE